MNQTKKMQRQSLWDWSLKHYEKPGVSQLLLDGQDRFGLHVNIILWCCWCADHYYLLNDLELRRAIDGTGAWSKDITIPLRHVRRALKNAHYNDGSERVKKIQHVVKEIELEAEHIELEVYERITGEGANSDLDIMTLARRNLSAYISYCGAARLEGFSVSMLEDIAYKVLAGDGTS